MMRRRWSKKLLGLILAGALGITGVPGLAAEAAEPANAAEQEYITAEAAAGNEAVTEPTTSMTTEKGESAAAGISVAEAIAKGNSGESVTVTGYIVGHAAGSQTADFEAPFGNDYNFLIADTAGERDKAKLVDVQIPSGPRAEFGLQSNPDIIGKQVSVSGMLAAYNNFPGLKSVTALEFAAAQPGEPGERKNRGNRARTPESRKTRAETLVRIQEKILAKIRETRANLREIRDKSQNCRTAPAKKCCLTIRTPKPPARPIG
ncbi:hypothetical protein PbDSM24746_36880 [Paenibacillus macerans]|nr:DUF6359 domain-containing protein [Paenibacillus macerans]GBK63684.1 hypothetical protein PbDSM24746_36880 [Paenibacillus macerans]GBK69997.1 hypothetical protein PbJCM17693_37050 [Paenibacillus macerans]